MLRSLVEDLTDKLTTDNKGQRPRQLIVQTDTSPKLILQADVLCLLDGKRFTTKGKTKWFAYLDLYYFSKVLNVEIRELFRFAFGCDCPTCIRL